MKSTAAAAETADILAKLGEEAPIRSFPIPALPISTAPALPASAISSRPSTTAARPPERSIFGGNGDNQDSTRSGNKDSVTDLGEGSDTVTIHHRIVQFDTDAITLDEGNGGTTTISVTLTRPDLYDIAGSVTVTYIPYYQYNNENPTTDAADFAGGALPVDQIVSFAAGEQTKTITYAVNGDFDLESDEHFFLGLTDATGMDLGHQGNFYFWDDSLEVTLTNDDMTFAIAQDDSSALEGTPLTFTITRDGSSALEQTVSYAVSGSGTFRPRPAISSGVPCPRDR